MKIVANLFPILVLFLAGVSAAGQLPDRDRGIDLYREGKFIEAIELLEQSLTAYKKDRFTVMFLGAALHRSGRTDEAVKMFRKLRDIKIPQKQDPDLNPDVIKKKTARYTHMARQNNIQGRISVALEYGADGTIGFVLPFETLPDGLVDNVIEAAKQVQFRPAMKDGKPVATIGILEYSFTIY